MPPIKPLYKELDPYFVTGLVEAEGSFSINKHKDSRAKFNLGVSLRFKITMLANETELLNMVHSFFGCGTLHYNKDGSVDFIVQDLSSLNRVIIPHLSKYTFKRY